MCLKKQNQENLRSARKRALTTIRTGSACGWVRRGVPGMVPWELWHPVRGVVVRRGPGAGGGHARPWCECSPTEGACGSTLPGTVGDCTSHTPLLPCPGHWSWGPDPPAPLSSRLFLGTQLSAQNSRVASRHLWAVLHGVRGRAGAGGSWGASGSESPQGARCLEVGQFPRGQGWGPAEAAEK